MAMAARAQNSIWKGKKEVKAKNIKNWLTLTFRFSLQGKAKSMKFAPEGHDYNGFTQYFFEGKELEFLEILLSGKDKQHCCCKSEHVNCEFCPDSKCLTKGDVYRLVKKLRQLNKKRQVKQLQ